MEKALSCRFGYQCRLTRCFAPHICEKPLTFTAKPDPYRPDPDKDFFVYPNGRVVYRDFYGREEDMQ